MQVTKNYDTSTWIVGYRRTVCTGEKTPVRIDSDIDRICHLGEDNDGYLNANALLISAAPDLVGALIDQAKETAFAKRLKEIGSQNALYFAEEHWPDYLTTSAREALIKAGVITE